MWLVALTTVLVLAVLATVFVVSLSVDVVQPAPLFTGYPISEPYWAYLTGDYAAVRLHRQL